MRVSGGMTLAAVDPDLSRAPRESDEMIHFAHKRAAIDLIATLRAQVARCALLGTYLLRPHPITPETDDTRDRWRAQFDEQYQAMQRAYSLLDGSDPDGTLPQDTCTWLQSSVSTTPKQPSTLRRMMEMTEEVRAALDDDQRRLDAALKAHFTFGFGEFHDTITDICDDLWTQLDHQRNEDLLQARENGDAIGNILARLERIGKHVRLVSLNASVEAARVGDAGKGLGVIAVEFKSLAEEIQHLAATARESIDDMTSNSG